MFKEAYEGTYRDKVKWFAGVADNVVHVTLHDLNNENVFYDHMIHVQGKPAFEVELTRICEYYIETILDIKPITDENKLIDDPQ